MMSNKISILKIRKILFRIVSGSRHPIPHSQPTWPHTVVTSEDLKPSPTHTKILNNVEQLFRFLFASVFRFFCNDDVRIDITVNKVTVHLDMLGFPAGAVRFFSQSHVFPLDNALLCVQRQHL